MIFIDKGTLKAEAARADRGYREIQEETGASLTSIAAAFHGRSSLRLTLFARIASALGLHVVVSFVPSHELPEWATESPGRVVVAGDRRDARTHGGDAPRPAV